MNLSESIDELHKLLAPKQTVVDKIGKDAAIVRAHNWITKDGYTLIDSAILLGISRHTLRRWLNKVYAIEDAGLLLTDWFVKAIKIHGNKWDYSTVECNNNGRIKSLDVIEITCKIHGVFLQTSKKHLVGQGCRDCGRIKLNNSRRITSADIIKEAGQYLPDYQKIIGINPQNKKHDKNSRILKIKCEYHGDTTRQFFTLKKTKNGCKDCCKHFK